MELGAESAPVAGDKSVVIRFPLFRNLSNILSADMTASSKARATKKARATLIDEWTLSQKASVRLFLEPTEAKWSP